MTDFSGQVVIVTGASRGIGAATARAFVAAGASVVLAARDKGALETVAGQLGGTTLVVPTDVTDDDSVRRLVEHTLERFGRLDAAVNNAGGSHRPTPLAELAPSEFDRVLNTNLRGTFLCLRHEIPALLATGGGAIVNMTSTAGLHPVGGISAYVAAKAGLIGLTRTAALDYAADGIRVNALAPGPIRTEKLEQAGEQARAAASRGVPEQRLGLPAEVGDAAVWLCGPESRFVTGATLPIDGGLVAGMRPFGG
jgi:NAD(P)-dependent dehydrogenase (short-subunit alcohol dehydrogenase family)